jgi:hypothetical protein
MFHIRNVVFTNAHILVVASIKFLNDVHMLIMKQQDELVILAFWLDVSVSHLLTCLDHAYIPLHAPDLVCIHL